MHKEYFQCSARLHLLRNHCQKKMVQANFLDEYAEACLFDLGFLVDGIGSIFAENFSNYNLKITILKNELSFGARVSRIEGNCHKIEINLGTFLAADDISGIVCPYFEHSLGPLHSSESFDLMKSDPNWDSRFVSYEYFNSNELKVDFRSEQIFGMYSFKEFPTIRYILSNMIITWVIAHEIGHICLGHVDHINKMLEENSLDEFEFENLDKNYYFSRELEADFFATSVLVFLATRIAESDFKDLSVNKDMVSENWHSYIFCVVSYTALMFQKASIRLSSIGKREHPAPLSRAYNAWVAFEYSIQHVIDPINKSHRLFHAISPYQTVRRYLWLTRHVYFVAKMIKADFSRNSKDLSVPLKQTIEGRLGLHLEHTESVKWVCSLWNARFRLNFFTEYEELHQVIDEWSNVFRLAAEHYGPMFRSTMTDLSPCIALTIQNTTVQAFEIFDVEAKQEVLNVEKMRKVFIDVLLIHSVSNDLLQQSLNQNTEKRMRAN